MTYFKLSEQASSAHARVQVSQNLMCLSGSRHSSQAVLYCTMSYLLGEGGVPPLPAAALLTMLWDGRNTAQMHSVVLFPILVKHMVFEPFLFPL